MSRHKAHSFEQDRKVRAFTLVELLVVIVILAVLAAILLPVLSKAKMRAQSIQCLNNLKQWGLAFQLYAADGDDAIPRDGTDAGGTYSIYSGKSGLPLAPTTDLSGTPNDPYAWFNALPPTVAEKPLSHYYPPTGSPKANMPFPGNGLGKMWHCPAAKSGPSDNFMGSPGGRYGYFSYGMSIDLKLKSSINKGVIRNSFDYPNMPKLGTIRMPSATVLLTDTCFSPSLENGKIWDPGWSGTAGQNGTFPAIRWIYFPQRHNKREGVIVFCDGHSALYRWDYVYNLPGDSGKEEKFNPDIWWNPNRDK